MASSNVDKMIEVLHTKPELVAELHLVCSRIEEAADVDLTPDEKIEFFQELARLAPMEPSITLKWADRPDGDMIPTVPIDLGGM